jgi:hypothetical protein
MSRPRADGNDDGDDGKGGGGGPYCGWVGVVPLTQLVMGREWLVPYPSELGSLWLPHPVWKISQRPSADRCACGQTALLPKGFTGPSRAHGPNGVADVAWMICSLVSYPLIPQPRVISPTNVWYLFVCSTRTRTQVKDVMIKVNSACSSPMVQRPTKQMAMAASCGTKWTVQVAGPCARMRAVTLTLRVQIEARETPKRTKVMHPCSPLTSHRRRGSASHPTTTSTCSHPSDPSGCTRW